MLGALEPGFCILAFTLRLETRNNSSEPEMWVVSGYLVREISTGTYKYIPGYVLI
jgi:hypothetical protein